MEENRFQTPDSNLIDQNEVELQLASRWARLGASILDAIIMMIPLMLVLYLTGFFDQVLEGEEPSMMMNLVMGLVGVVVFAAINFKFLLESGQTVGKKALGIKIVDLEGELPSVQQHLLVRYAVYFGLGYIPMVGGLLSLVNVLFVFRGDKRCLHDLAAKTMVVRC
ncbi:MAG: hypothetical protein CMK83_22450 [Pseudomonadales bacterium]|jgi:uncharacterized RDD family membrane protein YckC|uniref:RDD family protein n=1 Tax=unclassified Ketobacter TaxID=2639109 RepID=UPI000C8E5DA1|nr:MULTISPECIES: RDD family protein [unclassified Ketobacter]MAQ26979.1 hypothetical protein [Pseudomonadales bacterium]MEC8811727.1 RDD family protein [Pseudomonadota bacterium]HAG94693.1 RDD family protein [Gammaproteobacteria bacterium]RLT91923.1 MAG: RDD family protein [Ketobacter sp. GenoA1]RLT93851.1 MAG: RDD family protein [Ketobacter sp.]|tara:strand:- start:4794 stop:5291 length:498 start_codon:yes stop_codon:yes gene_type:complete